MRSIPRVFLALTTATLLTACDDDPSGPVNEGRVRAVHAISNVAVADVLLNTASYKQNLAYKSSDGYRTIATGATTLLRSVRIPSSFRILDVHEDTVFGFLLDDDLSEQLAFVALRP